MWLNEQILCIENPNICRSSTSIVPKLGKRSLEGPPKSAQCHLLSVSLTFCLSYTSVFLPRLPSLHTLSSSCPSFLASEEVTFINGKFMCMTAPKPELCLDHPRRLSVNSGNHQSAKYLPFRAHQPYVRCFGVIYRIKSISILQICVGIDMVSDLHDYTSKRQEDLLCES